MIGFNYRDNGKLKLDRLKPQFDNAARSASLSESNTYPPAISFRRETLELSSTEQTLKDAFAGELSKPSIPLLAAKADVEGFNVLPYSAQRRKAKPDTRSPEYLEASGDRRPACQSAALLTTSKQRSLANHEYTDMYRYGQNRPR